VNEKQNGFHDPVGSSPRWASNSHHTTLRGGFDKVVR
jgi:hypothetical protein